jgi:hypothetical protein
MDGYLTSEALQALNALNAMAPGKKLSGFLIGHKRGHRFFVEKIFPAPLGFRLNFKNFSRLDRLFQDNVIGFYSLGAGEKQGKKLFQPFACGKMYLDGRRSGRKNLRFKASLIDFKGGFVLEPIKLILEK